MNKIVFIFSGIFTVIGICTLIVINLINSVLPKIGKAAFQTNFNGSYSPDNYTIDVPLLIVVSIIMIVIGIVGAYYSIKRETGK